MAVPQEPGNPNLGPQFKGSSSFEHPGIGPQWHGPTTPEPPGETAPRNANEFRGGLGANEFNQRQQEQDPAARFENQAMEARTRSMAERGLGQADIGAHLAAAGGAKVRTTATRPASLGQQFGTRPNRVNPAVNAQVAQRGISGSAGVGGAPGLATSTVRPGEAPRIAPEAPGSQTGAPRAEATPGSPEASAAQTARSRVQQAKGAQELQVRRSLQWSQEASQLNRDGVQRSTMGQPGGGLTGGPAQRLGTNVRIAKSLLPRRLGGGQTPLHAQDLASRFVSNYVRNKALMSKGGWVAALQGAQHRDPFDPRSLANPMTRGFFHPFLGGGEEHGEEEVERH